MTEWVLRLDAGGWWSGRGREATDCPLDAASFSSPDQARAAMRAVGWAPITPGWIEPMRVAVARSRPAQLSLAI